MRLTGNLRLGRASQPVRGAGLPGHRGVAGSSSPRERSAWCWLDPCAQGRPPRAAAGQGLSGSRSARQTRAWRPAAATSRIRLGDVVPTVVRRINPHLHDRPRRRVAEPFARRYPPGSGLGCLGVPAPPPGRTRTRGPRGTRGRELRKIRDRGGRLIDVPRAEHQAHPAVQLVELELSQRVVLAEQGDQPLAVGVAGRRRRPPGAEPDTATPWAGPRLRSRRPRSRSAAGRSRRNRTASR